MISYAEELRKNKAEFPFDKWRTYFEGNEEDGTEGMKQYTAENCNKAQQIMDELVEELIQLGKEASEPDKVSLFKIAIEALNQLNDEAEGLIETVEREELCDLFDSIGRSAGLDPQNYGDGEGIADEWRNW